MVMVRSGDGLQSLWCEATDRNNGGEAGYGCRYHETDAMTLVGNVTLVGESGESVRAGVGAAGSGKWF